ncbi:FAD-dependent oxidoreductase [Halococcus thailandensis]|uniref:FAD-dependent oxidoreductase n=1 Tax=Halococcus thailandensis TaxID=335952 RepID=UPI0009B5C051
MSSGYHIIGGGIVGASIAYHLSCRTDAPVVVHEQGELASETTRKSLAFFGYYGDNFQYQMKRYAMDLYNQFFGRVAKSSRLCLW